MFCSRCCGGMRSRCWCERQCIGCKQGDSWPTETEEIGVSRSVDLIFLDRGESISLARRKILYSRSFTTFALLRNSLKAKPLGSSHRVIISPSSSRYRTRIFEAGKCASGEQFCLISCISLSNDISLIKRSTKHFLPVLHVHLVGRHTVYLQWRLVFTLDYSNLQDYQRCDWSVTGYPTMIKLSKNMSKNFVWCSR